MNTKIKLIITSLFGLIAAGLLIWREQYVAMLWCIAAIAFDIALIISQSQTDVLLEKVKKDSQTIYHTNRKLTIAYGKNEAMMANCKRYQEELKRLRSYEKNTNRRRNNQGNTSDIQG